MTRLAILCAILLSGCYIQVYPKRKSVIRSESISMVAGRCIFETEPQTDPWFGSKAKNFGWLADCDSFNAGDSVWIEVRK